MSVSIINRLQPEKKLNFSCEIGQLDIIAFQNANLGAWAASDTESLASLLDTNKAWNGLPKQSLMAAILLTCQVNAISAVTTDKFHVYYDIIAITEKLNSPQITARFDSTKIGVLDESKNAPVDNDGLKTEIIFNGLVKKWKNETGHFSVIARRYESPAYKAILNMREAAIPLILNELKRSPDRWFSALEELTGANPAKEAVNFYEAVDQWVAWGIANEYIA